MTAIPGKTTSAPSAEDLLAALDQPLAPVRVSILYRLGLLLVAAAMVLLPIVYLALIAGLGWLVYLHAVHGVVILDGRGGGRVMLLKLTIYLAPLVAGVVAVLFMLKPLLARAQRPPDTLEVTSEDQPLLFQFVEHLTSAVGAPMPRDVRVDCEVNASAGFRRGLASFFGSDLVLTVGLPLVAGLSLRQLAGVLAHEFGHFAQGGAMRITYLIRSVNGWFARVVYQRDRWDERLDRMARESEHWAAQLILAATRATVWTSRRVLWVLMNVGHLISCFMLRQMEYDADRYEARVAGSETFGGTARRLRELGAGSQAAIQQLQLTWSDGHLGDDLPALITRRAAAIPKEAIQEIHRISMEEESSWFATHPADSDRIASASQEATAGIFRFDEQATLLFSGFDELCREATLHYYATHEGLDVSGLQLVSAAELEADEEMIAEGGRAISEIFGEGLAALRPLRLGTPTELSGDRQPPATRKTIETDDALREAAETAATTLDRTTERLCDTASAEALLQAGYGIDAASFHLPSADIAGVERARARAEQERSEALTTLREFEELTSRRLIAALRTLHTAPPSASTGRVARRREECRLLLPALRCLAGVREQDLALRYEFGRLTSLFHAMGESEPNQRVIDKIFEVSRAATGYLASLRSSLSEVEHPFARSQDSKSIGEVLITDFPAVEEPGAVGAAAEHLLSGVPFLYFRVVGRLATIALEIEKAAATDPDQQTEVASA